MALKAPDLQEIRAALAQALAARSASAVSDLLDAGNAARLLVRLSRTDAADVLEEMSPDDAADVVDELSEDHAAAILVETQAEVPEEVRTLLGYPSDGAAGLMTRESAHPQLYRRTQLWIEGLIVFAHPSDS